MKSIAQAPVFSKSQYIFLTFLESDITLYLWLLLSSTYSS